MRAGAIGFSSGFEHPMPRTKHEPCCCCLQANYEADVMPLVDANLPVQPRPDMSEFGFQMTAPDGKSIGVIVSREALQDIDSPLPLTEAEHVARLERHRNLFATIGNDEFDA